MKQHQDSIISLFAYYQMLPFILCSLVCQSGITRSSAGWDVKADDSEEIPSESDEGSGPETDLNEIETFTNTTTKKFVKRI